MHIEHVAMWTRDLERLRTFYGTWFGAVGGEKYESSRGPFVSCFLTFSSGARLELMQIPELAARAQGDFTGLAHVAFSAGSRAAVGQLTAALRNAGHRIVSQPRVTGDGYYESVVADPDGNIVEITV